MPETNKTKEDILISLLQDFEYLKGQYKKQHGSAEKMEPYIFTNHIVNKLISSGYTIQQIQELVPCTEK